MRLWKVMQLAGYVPDFPGLVRRAHVNVVN